MLARRLGEFVASIDAAALPHAVVQAIRLRVLDTLGAGLAGVALGNHRVIAPLLQSEGRVRIWGVAGGRSAHEAALVNSFATHSTYLEDGSRFTGGHPSSVVIPAVLADAQQRGASSGDVVAAVAAGYEVFLRLGRAIYPACVQRGFQSTAVLGAVSSAAAIARLRQLSPEACGHAISIGANLGAGFKEALKCSSTQPLQVARSCEGGMVAATLAQAGQAGAPRVLENGFLPALGALTTADIEAIGADLGDGFRIHETYLKRHAGCRGNHAPVDCALELVAAHGVGASDVRRIRVGVDTVTRAAAIEPPASGEEAQFSIGFSVAVALVEGDASIFRYTDALLSEEPVRAMMERLEVVVDTSLDEHYPSERGAWVELELNTGERFRRAVSNARGEPEWPLTAADVEQKFMQLATPCLGKRAGALRDAIRHLENVDATQIAELLAPQEDMHNPI